jgi:hypothetical protein
MLTPILYGTDADSLDPLEVSGRGWNSSLTTISLYCVIGCIIVLVIIAIIQASCTIYKVSRKSPSSVNKVRMNIEIVFKKKKKCGRFLKYNVLE